MSDTFSYILPLVILQGFATLNQKIKLDVYACSLLLQKKKKNFQQLQGSRRTKHNV